jgi:hypothetical protein
MSDRYRDDPAWQAAQQQFLDESGNCDEQQVRSILAAVDMYLVQTGSPCVAPLAQLLLGGGPDVPAA